MSDSALLTVQNLSVSIGTLDVLEDISFTLNRGTTVAILGPNGSGKSTLFRALLGLTPHTGTVTWAPNVSLGYVPQSFSVESSLPLTVAEFFQLKKAPQPAMLHALRDVGMLGIHDDHDALTNQPLGTLSGGQLQRVLIAWTIADSPTVLLFDEPTSGVDIGGQQNIYALLDTLKKERGLTVLLISHDLHVVFSHADTVLCINKHLTCSGIPSEALDSKALAMLYGPHVSLYSHDHHA